MKKALTTSLCLIALSPMMSNASVVDDVLKSYEAQGASNFSAQRGEAMWLILTIQANFVIVELVMEKT